MKISLSDALAVLTVILFVTALLLSVDHSETLRQSRINEAYTQGIKAGQVELNPLLNPYSEDYLESAWKRGYAQGMQPTEKESK